MFIDIIPLHVMQMTIVEVIDMVTMAHSRMSTAWTMLMPVIRMMLVHGSSVPGGSSGRSRRFNAA
ncbi:MAG: hypothetical protein J2P53_12200 [Bradyrhizobiaceae bacterium]|nr:hypothetical protein [Bradyrhizobiaceae bacterium]